AGQLHPAGRTAVPAMGRPRAAVVAPGLPRGRCGAGGRAGGGGADAGVDRGDVQGGVRAAGAWVGEVGTRAGALRRRGEGKSWPTAIVQSEDDPPPTERESRLIVTKSDGRHVLARR